MKKYIDFLNQVVSDSNEDKINTIFADLLKFKELIEIWNKRINLVSRNDMNNILDRHIMDSILILKHIKLGTNVLDIGTGGGFPGIPLAVLLPQSHFTLNDITQKKILFLQKVKYNLFLENAEILHKDFYDIELDKYDSIISRAVTQIDKFGDFLVKNINTTAQVILMKNSKLSAEEDIWVKNNPDKLKKMIHYKDFLGKDRVLVILSK